MPFYANVLKKMIETLKSLINSVDCTIQLNNLQVRKRKDEKKFVTLETFKV